MKTLLACPLFLMFAIPASAAVVFDMAVIGDAGNAPFDAGSQFVNGRNKWGAVASPFRMSRFETTNQQFVDFLNAKATTGDPFHLYDPQMSSNANGGVVRTLSNGAFSYRVGTTDTTIVGSGGNVKNRPIVFVTLYSAMRFCNWLQNGQGNGDTETGAYALLGGTPTPSNYASVTRNPNALFFIPNHDEWFKAGYYQPASEGGDMDDYWFYPTRTNDLPNSDQPPGNPSIQTNVANFNYNDGLANGYNDGYAITGSTSFNSGRNYMTDVGSYSSAPTYYGTFDQGGNAWEWVEERLCRGGSWNGSRGNLRADLGGAIVTGGPDQIFPDIGFRVASVIPEPGVAFPLLLGVLFLHRQSRYGRGERSACPKSD